MQQSTCSMYGISRIFKDLRKKGKMSSSKNVTINYLPWTAGYIYFSLTVVQTPFRIVFLVSFCEDDIFSFFLFFFEKKEDDILPFCQRSLTVVCSICIDCVLYIILNSL
jgi:hypothetical protein